MPTNEILPFSETDIGTNLLTQVEYEDDPQRLIGHQSGVARSRLANKQARQASFVSSALAQAVSDLTGQDVLDDGDVAGFVALIKKALKDSGQPVGSPYFWVGLEDQIPDDVIELYGQELSRSTYARLYVAWGTIHGDGNGTTTFNAPDMRGIAPFGKDNMGGAAAGKLTSAGSGVNGTVIGAKGGHQLTQTHLHANTAASDPHDHGFANSAVGVDVAGEASCWTSYDKTAEHTSPATVTVTMTNANYGGGNGQNVPPAMVGLWLARTGN